MNEGYICFRRRDVKAVRKTRASQINTSDKLARLQAELTIPLDLAKSVLQREELKRDALRHSRHIWEQRMQMVELRLQNPALAEKGDATGFSRSSGVVSKDTSHAPAIISRLRL